MQNTTKEQIRELVDSGIYSLLELIAEVCKDKAREAKSNDQTDAANSWFRDAQSIEQVIADSAKNIGLFRLQDRTNQTNRADKEFFDSAFEGMDIPKDLRTASERICRAYAIKGLCDPGYIANIIAKETGRGDGLSNFASSQTA